MHKLGGITVTHLRLLLVPIVAAALLLSGVAVAESQNAPLPSELNTQYAGYLSEKGYDATGCCSDPGYPSSCCGCRSRWCCCGTLADPWKLCPENCCGIDFGGWVESGFYDYDTGMVNDYPDHFNVHQVWLYAEKALNSECGWDWGFRFDYLYGTDAPDTQAFGNRLDTWDFGWFQGGY